MWPGTRASIANIHINQQMIEFQLFRSQEIVDVTIQYLTDAINKRKTDRNNDLLSIKQKLGKHFQIKQSNI